MKIKKKAQSSQKIKGGAQSLPKIKAQTKRPPLEQINPNLDKQVLNGLATKADKICPSITARIAKFNQLSKQKTQDRQHSTKPKSTSKAKVKAVQKTVTEIESSSKKAGTAVYLLNAQSAKESTSAPKNKTLTTQQSEEIKRFKEDPDESSLSLANLSNEQLSEILSDPEIQAKLEFLEIVDSTGLTNLPEALKACTKLIIIATENCPIEEIPEELTNTLPELKVVELPGSQLTRKPPNIVSNYSYHDSFIKQLKESALITSRPKEEVLSQALAITTIEERNAFYTSEENSTITDVMVIGSGPAGLMQSLTDAKNGKSVILIESRSEETFDLRPGLMKLDDDSKDYLKNIIDEELSGLEGTVLTHIAKEESNIEHKKSIAQIRAQLEKEPCYLQTKIIQRLLKIAIETKYSDKVTLVFNHQVSNADAHLQTVQLDDDSIIAFSAITFADGTAIFNQKEQTCREKLITSLGEKESIKKSHANPDRNNPYNFATWIKLPKPLHEWLTERTKELKKIDDDRFFYIALKETNPGEQPKAWFAGNISQESHTSSPESKKPLLEEDIRTSIQNCLISQYKGIPEEVLASLKEIQIENPNQEEASERKLKSNSLKSSLRTWEMENPEKENTMLNELEKPAFKMGLLGEAKSIGDAKKVPDYFKGEGTKNAIIQGSIPSFID